MEGEEIYAAVINGKIAGFVSVWAAENFLHHLYVAPEYQNRGAGNALIKECISYYGLPLSLKSASANERACSFYEHNNWVVKEKGRDSDGPYNYYTLKEI